MLEQLTAEEFNAFAKKHPLSTFFQSSYWGELKKSTGWIPHILGIKENGKIKGATLLLAKKIPIFHKFIFYSPRGFLIDFDNFEFLHKFVNEIRKYVKKQNGIFIKINPYVIYQERDVDGNIVEGGINNEFIIRELQKIGFIHNGFTINYGKDLEPRWLSVLDVKDKSEKEVLKNMRGTTRWGIQNSYKHGLKLIEVDESRIEEYKKLMEHTGERRGFIDRPLSYYKKMYQEFSKNDYIKIMLVELDTKENLNSLCIQKENTQKKLDRELGKEKKKDNLIKELSSQIEAIDHKIGDIEKISDEHGEKIIVAGGLFMTFGRQVISLFGASYREFMKFNGQYFLNFEMIKYAIKNGYEKFNFFGISGEFTEDSPLYGLFNFKRGFNASVVELIGEFTLVTNSLYYKIYNMMFSVYRKMKRWIK